MNLFNATFWASGFWQGIGALVSIISLFVSPLLSMLVERLFGKKDQQDYINAYRAIALPDSVPGPGETLFFLPIQALASYFLFIILQRVFFVGQETPTTLLVISAIGVFLPTWLLCSVRRKSLAKLLTWHLCLSMVLLCLLLIGLVWHKGGNAYVTSDFTFVKHWVGQYLSPNIKQFPLIASLRSISLRRIPIDMKVASPQAARILFIQIYFSTLAVLLFFYTLYKRHRANRFTAFLHLNEKQRRDELEKVDYQKKLMSLDLLSLAKQEKEGNLALKTAQHGHILEQEELALARERLVVESTRLDVEKKRADYTLDLAVRVLDTIYGHGGDPEERIDLIRNTLAAFKDFGEPEIKSTTVVLQVLHDTQPQPRAIPVTTSGTTN